MLARPTLTRPVQDDASKPKSQSRPTEERFLLRVDGQIKGSFSSKEDAATAGAVIKKARLQQIQQVLVPHQHNIPAIKGHLENWKHGAPFIAPAEKNWSVTISYASARLQENFNKLAAEASLRQAWPCSN
jgi:hypothetical protein